MRVAGWILVAIMSVFAGRAALADAPAKSPEQLLAKALQNSTAEVELGKLAQKHAESSGVNALGERLQRDHARIGKMLTAIAHDRGMVLPVSLDSGQRAQIEALTAKTGADFDTAYIDQMVTNHNAAVVLFTALAQCDDRELSRVATRTLPILREDQRLADSYEKLTPAGGGVQAVARK